MIGSLTLKDGTRAVLDNNLNWDSDSVELERHLRTFFPSEDDAGGLPRGIHLLTIAGESLNGEVTFAVEAEEIDPDIPLVY